VLGCRGAAQSSTSRKEGMVNGPSERPPYNFYD
jgi:hypothetical protein